MKKIAVLLATCVIAISAAPQKKSSKLVSTDIGGRIINGEQAATGQFPWQVAVYLKTENETHFCGGSLISDEWVLTAGHCVGGFSSWTVLLGITELADTDAISIDTDEAFTHEDFSLEPYQNDIALIHLSKKVTLTANIQPIPLGDEELDAGVNVTVSGWGKTSDASNSVSPVLNFINLVTISNDDCIRAYGDLINDEIVCADFTTQSQVQSTCNGDSGGPVVTNADSNPVHVAVVSFVSDLGCESGYPSGYTRTAYYRDWIREKTGI